MTLNSLSERVKDLLIAYPAPDTLESAIQLAIRVDRRLRDRQNEEKALIMLNPVTQDSPVDSGEPIQLGAFSSCSQEREKRFSEGLCLYSGHHPESNGQTERKNQDVEQFLRCFLADNQEMWLEYLPLAELALNNHTSSSAGCSPFNSCTGRHPSFGPFAKIGAAVPEEERFSGNLDMVWTNVLQNLKEANWRSKKYFDKKRREVLFAVVDMVWLSSRNLCLMIPSKKLGPKFVGPFKVVQVVNSAAVRLDIPLSWRINSVFHVSLLKKVDTPDKEAMLNVPPVDEDGEFEISRILDSRWHRGRLQYLVSWRNFSPEDNSWVKAEDVLASRLIKAFHRRFPNKIDDMVARHLPTRNLRSSQDLLLYSPLISSSHNSIQDFSPASLILWNFLPQRIRLLPTTETFKRKLKTHLFRQAYNL
ncbi:unnamed protein product [Ranitomeya imitator]|uniref:Chromo domain-containing protein n=1 Tax=Ranitomeya imitator TaxID=111125 RepID=A0ABN9M292_9NEOB|nr:unnamed protein product [Ranitomeya imitator]